ncbi:MAG: FAD-binding oxidoreductase [Gammaproteobacteria bacterium]|nr:FAD-binding oxidoreductase [Gammaproteobacteria bacterium]
MPGIWRSVPFWLLDPLGPLSVRFAHLPSLMPWFWRFLRQGNMAKVQACAAAQWQLNSRVWQDFEPFLQTIGYAHGVKQKGMLKVFNSRKNYTSAPLEWQIKRDQGFALELIEREQLRAMEPALGDAKQFAVFHPQWRVVDDPKQMLANLRHWLQAQGVQFVKDKISAILHTDQRVSGVRGKAQDYDCEQLVVAAGAWSAKLSGTVGERCLLAAERGYNTTIAAPGIELNHMLFFVEEQFVATPMGLGLRIGGAAEFAGLDAPPNYERSRALLTMAKRFLPDLAGGEGEMWMGHRPSTPDTLPVMGPSLNCAGLYYAFGHGHLGLTQCVTSGELIAQALLEGKTEALQPYSIGRFA